jgi:hypothetical protein
MSDLQIKPGDRIRVQEGSWAGRIGTVKPSRTRDPEDCIRVLFDDGVVTVLAIACTTEKLPPDEDPQSAGRYTPREDEGYDMVDLDIAVRQFIRAGIEMARVLRGCAAEPTIQEIPVDIRIDHELERIVDRYVESYPDQAENA